MASRLPRSGRDDRSFPTASIDSQQEDSADQFEADRQYEKGDSHFFDFPDEKRTPLKSTLPRSAGVGLRQMASPAERHMPAPQHRRSQPYGRHVDGKWRTDVDEVTLSTDFDGHTGSASQAVPGIDESLDESTITDIGRGRPRTTDAVKGGHKVPSYLYDHFSPAVAARHDILHAHASLHPLPSRRPHTSPSKAAALHAMEDESDSDQESISSTSSADVMGATAPFYDIAESTGNHHGLISSPEARPRRSDRPRLDLRALDELDKVTRKGTVSDRKARGKRGGGFEVRIQRWADLWSRHLQSARAPLDKAEARQHKSPFKSSAKAATSKAFVPPHARREDVESRKFSSGSSSNGKKRPGTDASTSGETLVDKKGSHPADGNLVLPSGQLMGKGISASGFALPDITGMTSALESPVRARVGVQHKAIDTHNLHDIQVATAQIRNSELDRLAAHVKGMEANLGQTQNKVEKVEASSKHCADQLGLWRKEWSSWREEQRAGQARSTLGQDGRGEETGCDKKIRLMNEHIARLSSDLKSYRTVMDELRNEKADTHPRPRESPPRGKSPWFSSPRKAAHFDADEPSQEDYDILKSQVDTVAHEVQRLKSIVRQRERAHIDKAASSPIKPSHGGATFPSIGISKSNPFAQKYGSNLSSKPDKKVADVPEKFDYDHDDDGDHCLPTDEEALRRESHRNCQQQRRDGEAVRRSHKRAEKAFSKVSAVSIEHDARTCTVCSRHNKREKRRAARQTRAGASAHKKFSSSSSEQDLQSADEHMLFEILKRKERDGKRAGLASLGLDREDRQRAVLERILQEQKDDFFHFRKTYSEMADELKKLDPSMHPVDRKILADAIIDMVETLEHCATRINVLQATLFEVEESISEDSDEDMAFGKAKSRKHGTNQRKPRYSPPMVDHPDSDGSDIGTDAYRRFMR